MKETKRINTDTLYKVFIYVALITLAITIIIPVAWVFMASIKENQEFYGNPWALPQGIHFENFREAFVEAGMGDYFLNSIIVTSLALVFLLVLALPAAYVLSRFEFVGSKFINGFIKAGLFINVSYITVPIFLMLLGWDQSLRQIFDSGFFLNNLSVLALIYAVTALPFTIFLLSSYFETLPSDFEEAANIDGAGYFRTMFSIMLPMAKPSIIIVILFNFLLFWNEYILALTLIPGDKKTLPVGLLNLLAADRAAVNYGPMYAGMVIVMLPTLILYIIVQKRLTQGMTVGGVKG
ncbi:sugar ABC transporter permease [Halolactibacillus alkaliphilus]|uniref:Sugar ABC transporter permease n=1 Tax=Halolactibacillus alkaliphilus TaxID=442899 RepID=A0A511WYL6_9BACI|nr:carbohydrate ABC transporter permease [Halolactibacillus alkaliphilus]GEN55621.1 sugar ABC transporter permease [Halolactibacillus alkaliphilus]GGN63716.1 sugar ABC transporter permease [Halolactibacillus alkaliphilus]SFO62570.1 N-acetylglucosamine transport system permease protein [Halolactibacillus alkaliphilus]